MIWPGAWGVFSGTLDDSDSDSDSNLSGLYCLGGAKKGRVETWTSRFSEVWKWGSITRAHSTLPGYHINAL